MLTPIDIREKEFDKGRSYTREVRNFLAKVASEYEVIYSKNAELTDKINQLESKLANYEKIEDSMKSALLLAQRTADSTIESANKEADNILLNARLKADNLHVEAADHNNRIKLANKSLMDRFSIYKKSCLDFLEQQKEFLSAIEVNFDDDDVDIKLEKVYPDAANEEFYDEEEYALNYDDEEAYDGYDENSYDEYEEDQYSDEEYDDYDDYDDYDEEYDDIDELLVDQDTDIETK